MSLDVKVVIDVKKSVAGSGFGVPLIFCGVREEETPYTECADLEEVGAVFAQDSPVYKAAMRLFGQKKPPEKIAVMGSELDAVSALPAVKDRAWRHLIVASLGEQGESSLQDIAAYIEAQKEKIFFARVRDLSEISGSGNSLTVYERTFCLYMPEDVDVPEAAVVGASAGKPVGSITYKNQVLTGVEPSALTGAGVQAAADLGCYCIVKKAGDVVTSEGKVANGEYLDIVDSRDYIIGEIEYRTQKALNLNDKVPYDNNGIAMLEAICVNVLQEVARNGMIAVNDQGLPDYSVDYAPRSETTGEERAARRYVRGAFTFALAGAVHEAVIQGIIEI